MRQASLKFFALRPLAVAIAGLVPVFHLALLPQHMSAADATTQPADPADAGAAEIKASFVDLANPDETVRSAAILKLMGLPADDLPTLKKVVEQCRPLLPAQTSALRQIVTQVFLSGEHYEFAGNAGFLGIKMEEASPITFLGLTDDGTLPVTGVVIKERLPGFPGARMLQDGDIVLSILDQPNSPLRGAQSLITIVSGMECGATVHFLILRRGQIIPINVKLAPRPIDVRMDSMDRLDEARRKRANEYWDTEFAALVKEQVS